jgi:hypothetical protein
VTDAQIERLLELVSTKSKKLWHEDNAFRLVWRSEYDKMVSHYVERITEVVDKWMATAAGEWFVEKRKADQKGHASSHKLVPEDIGVFDGHAGLSWGVKDVYEIFEILVDVVNTDDVIDTSKLEDTALVPDH